MFFPVVHKNFDKINTDNLKMFEETGQQNPYEQRYTCCICGRPTSIWESFSCLGERLTCWDCRHDKDIFPTDNDVTEWIWANHCWDTGELEREIQEDYNEE